MSRLFALITLLLLLLSAAWPVSAAMRGGSSKGDWIKPHVYIYDDNRKTAQIDNAVSDLEASQAFISCACDAESASTMAYVHPKQWRVILQYLDTVGEIGEWGYHYDSREVSMWPSEDPIGESGGINLYGYVGNGPIGASDSLGLDALILAGGNHKAPSFFHDIAITNGQGYEATHPGQRAHVVDVRSVDDVQNALKSTANIDRLDYIGHSGAGVLYLSATGILKKSDVAALDTSNIQPGAEINLEGCNTATGGSEYKLSVPL